MALGSQVENALWPSPLQHRFQLIRLGDVARQQNDAALERGEPMGSRRKRDKDGGIWRQELFGKRGPEQATTACNQAIHEPTPAVALHSLPIETATPRLADS